MKNILRVLTVIKSNINNVIILALTITIILGDPMAVLANTYTPEQQAQLDAIEAQNKQLQNQLNGLYSQQRTLENEIAIANAQSNALQIQINDTRTKIDINNEQISSITTEIKNTEAELARQKILLGEYVRQMYIDGQASSIQLILTSNKFSDFVDKSQYLNTMQEKISDAAKSIEVEKGRLENQKNNLEITKANLDSLKASQDEQRSALSAQIAYKDYLITNNQSNQDAASAKIAENNANSYIIICLATGACNGSANGDLKIVNQPLYYAQNDVPGTYDGSHSFAYWGCLITSLAMAHGKTPQQEAKDHTYSYGMMNSDATSGSLTNWTTANKVLASGGKVIMHIDLDYDGEGEHFVLAVGYSGGKYLINDPYRGLSAGYEKSQVLKLLLP